MKWKKSGPGTRALLGLRFDRVEADLVRSKLELRADLDADKNEVEEKLTRIEQDTESRLQQRLQALKRSSTAQLEKQNDSMQALKKQSFLMARDADRQRRIKSRNICIYYTFVPFGFQVICICAGISLHLEPIQSLPLETCLKNDVT